MSDRSSVTPEEGRAYFWRLMDFNLMPIYTWGYEGTITSANDAFLDLMGYTREEYDSNGINWRDMIPLEYLSADAAAENDLTGTSTFAHEKEFIRKDGTRIRVRIYDGVIEGEPTMSVGVAIGVDGT